MKLRVLRSNSLGQSAIEFAFALAFLLAMLFVLSDMTRICYNWLSLTLAVDRAGRYGKTVQESVRAQEVQAEVIRVAKGLGIELSNKNVSVQTAGTAMTVEAAHIVTITPLTGILFMITGDYGTHFTVAVTEVIQNETFGELVWT